MMEATITAVAEPLKFLSPQFILAVMVLLFCALIAILVYRTVTRGAGDGTIFRDFATPQFVFSMAMLLICVMMIWIAFYGPIPVSNDMQVAIITAVIIQGMTDLRKYWLNSTKDNEDKNKTIAAQAQTIAATSTGTGGALGTAFDPNAAIGTEVVVGTATYRRDAKGWQLQPDSGAA
jgi:hypothetical protein